MMKTALKAKLSLLGAVTLIRGGGFLFFYRNILLTGILLMATLSTQAATYYVSPSGNDTNSGASWELAKQTIQAAINISTNGDTVLVANGTYAPITIDPGITVRSVNGAQATTIDGGSVTRCVYMSTNSVLDGFTVRNGYSTENNGGGGVCVSGGTLQNCTISENASYYIGGGISVHGGTIENCVIVGNTTRSYGGGVYAEGSTMENCTISGNTTYWVGGGVLAYSSTVKNCMIIGNTATDWGYGGGVYIWDGPVQNCTISGNSADDGGGVVADEGTVENCTISENTADVDGGGVYAWRSLIENCVISGNAAGWGGGLNTEEATVRNCTISSNSAYESGGGISHWGGPVQYCTIRENTANWGGGIGAWVPDAIVENCLISGNTATNGGGGALVVWGGTVQNCVLSGNKAIAHEHPSFNFISPSCGGGVLAVWGGIVQNCQISENWSGDFGGGVYAFESLVQNCTLNENAAYFDGGGACVGLGKLWNCLVGGNAANDFGGGVYSYSSTVYNCTLSGNTASNSGGLYIESGTAQNFIAYYNQNGDAGGTISNISYSCIGTDIGGVGNITNEPQFVSLGTGYGTNHVPGNYRLQSASPCINAGLNQSWMTNALDLDGRPRILRDVVDMGAYEGSAADIIIMRCPEILSNRCDYGSNAASQMIEVWNAGTNAMVYALSANVDWLSLSPASGTNTGAIDLISVNYENAGLAPGTYTGIVSITSEDAINSPQVVTVYLWAKVYQTITFPTITSPQPVTSQVELAATASSGLPVSFAVASGPGRITAGTNLTFTGAGAVCVVASQAGNSIYYPAPNVTNSFIVDRLRQAITFPALPSQVTTSRVGLAATASSGLPVSFSVVSGQGIIVGGTNLWFAATGTVWIVASQGGSWIYYPAFEVMNAVTFVRTCQTTIYVNPSGNDANNGTTWALAKQTIQAGINVADVGDTVLVADGTYLLTNQISIPPGVTIRSVNGAQATIINGGGVTRCAYLYTNAVLDGFTVANGCLTGYNYGGGVFIDGGTIQNCTISGNETYWGGGVYGPGGTVQNCVITGNTSQFGGGVMLWGGGTVQNCTIGGNAGNNVGGGVYAYNGTVANCTISGNTSIYGGGIYVRYGTVQNCTIGGNTGSHIGGGVYVDYNGTVANCTISGNKAGWGGGLSVSGIGMVSNCTISVNEASWGGGVCNWYATMKDCTISGNWASAVGGGVYSRQGTIANCIVSRNLANEVGGTWLWNSTVRNCLVVGNSATNGIGGMEAGFSIVDNCTISGNSAPSNGGVYVRAGTVRNCIVYHNQGTDAIGPISYSCIGVGTNITGVGNITNAPQFVSTGTGYGTNLVPGNYRLRPTSPCINAGTNRSWMASAVDLDGLPRVLDGVVDMGAYEWSGTNILIMRNPAVLFNQCGYGSNASSQTIEVWNAGTNAMVYALSANVGWFTLSPASGTSVGETDLVNVNFASAELLPGAYTGIVTITSAEASNSPQVVTAYLMVDKVDQTIAFPPIPVQVTTSKVGLAATASSGLPVSFAVVSGPGIISDGTNLSFTGTGMVKIMASQVGDAIYNPAPEVTNAVLVERASQTITFPAIPDQVATSRVGLVATASSGLPVSFAAVSGPGTITGGTNLIFTAVGTVQIVASQAGDVIYSPAPDVVNSFNVTKAMAVVTLHYLNQTYNGLPRSVTASTVPEGLAVELTYDGSKTAPTDARAYSVVGMVNDSLYEGSANGILTVTKADQAITNFIPTNGTVFATTSTVSLAAQASSGLLVTNFSVVSGPGVISALTNLTFTNSGMVSVAVDQSGDHNWNPAPTITNSILVDRVDQTITFPAIPDQIATSRVGLVATASSGLPVSFAVVSGPGIIFGGTNLTFTAAGTVLFVASQAGNAIYNPAPNVTNSILVKQAQTITFPAIPAQVTTSKVGLAATASSGLPVSFAVVSGPGTISGGTTLIFTGAGTVQVKASQAGDAIYNPAPEVIRSINVTKSLAAVTLHNLNQTYNGMPRSVTASTVPAGLAVDLAYDGSSFVPVNAGTYAVAGVVNDNIYEGSANGTLTVAKADQAITRFVPTNGAVFTTTNTVGLAAQASSGLPVTNFAVVSGPGLISCLTNLAFTNSGVVTVTIDQAGDHNWNPAPAVTNLILVERASQTITFLPIPIQVVTSRVSLAATASSGLPVSFAVVSGPGVIIDGSNLSFTAVGTVYIAASQAGNAIWEPAASVTNAVLVTILPVGAIQFAVTSTEISEAGESVSLSVERIGGSYGPVSVEYTAADGTALAGADYTMQSSTLSWTDGDSSSKTITVFITDDSIDEIDETFTVTLSNAQGANLDAANVASVTILDNDEPPRGVLQFAVTSVEINEGGGSVSLTVTRTGGSYGAASVEYLASAGTATAGLDYEAVQGTLSWADGETSGKTISVPITQDSMDESDEAFNVTLSNAQGAGLGSASSATVTILDNDDPPTEDLNKVDLEVTNFKFVPVNLWAGENPAEIEFDLINTGPGELVTAGTQLEISFSLSANQIFGDADDIAIGTKIEVLALPTGTQTTIRYPGREYNEDITIPEGLSGDYYVFVSVRLASSAGLYDPDGASAMREGPINVSNHPTDEDEDDNRQHSVVNDYDGDGKTDLTSYDESSGIWAVRLSGSGQLVEFVFGGFGYESVPGDYDGDSKADPAIHQRSGQAWVILPSGKGYAAVNFNFGGLGETRGAVGDYLGNGQANPGLYEEQSGRWYVLLPDEYGSYEIATAVFGGPSYQPVVGDYDGDGKADPAVYAEATGEWLVMLSGQGYGVVSAIFGGPGYSPVVGDYDGDGKADPMLSTGREWIGLMSASGYALKRFSDLAGIPVAGDFDGDGTADPAVISAPGVWSFLSSLSAYLRQGPYTLRP